MAAPGSDIPAGFSAIDGIYARSFVAHIGPFYAREDEGGLCVAVRAQTHQCNPFGELHGGFIMALADFVCAYGLLRGPNPVPTIVTIQLGTQMIAGARLGDWVEVRPSLRRQGRSIAFVACEFTVGDRLIATADGVFRVLSKEAVASRFQRRQELLGSTP